MPEAIREQSIAVAADHAVPSHLDGPASLDAREIKVGESVVEADGDSSPEDTAAPCGGRHPEDPEDEEFSTIGLHCMASDLTSADLDVERTTKEFGAKIELLFKATDTDKDVPGNVCKREVSESLRSLAATMGSDKFNGKFDAIVRVMDEAEGKPGVAENQKGKWVIPTGSMPLSMYDAEIWQKSLPNLFPYGDGVFGLPNRRASMTIQQ